MNEWKTNIDMTDLKTRQETERLAAFRSYEILDTPPDRSIRPNHRSGGTRLQGAGGARLSGGRGSDLVQVKARFGS